MRCPNCGTESNSKFCPNCGTALPEQSEHGAQGTSGPEQGTYMAPDQADQPPEGQQGGYWNGAGHDTFPPKKKISGLSIAALVMSLFGGLAIIGIILGVIDLVQAKGETEPKRHKLSIAAIVIGVLTYVFLLGSIVLSIRDIPDIPDSMTPLPSISVSSSDTITDENDTNEVTPTSAESQPTQETTQPTSVQEEAPDAQENPNVGPESSLVPD